TARWCKVPSSRFKVQRFKCKVRFRVSLQTLTFELEVSNFFAEVTVEINSSQTIQRIIDECKTIAVVGLSSNPMRPSNGVARYMQRAGYRVVPVNPNEPVVLEEKAYASLADVPLQVDLVDVFRRPSEAGAAVDEAIRVG